MDRKKTILTAVLINAGLLVILFIAALTTQEESVPVAEQSALQKLPLFPDSADFTLQEQESSPSTPPLVEVAPAPAALSEPIVHNLPPLMPEVVPTAPPAMPAAPLPEAPLNQITVKKGDSLEKIAKAHHTTVDALIKINQLPTSFLRVGQTLKLPAEQAAAWTPPAKPAAEKSTGNGAEYYTVKVGDNPWTIAMKHHMKVDELLKLNQLSEERARKLKPGDRLRIK